MTLSRKLFQPRIRSMFATFFEKRLVEHIGSVFEATEQQLREGSGVSHGVFVYRLAVGMGYRPAAASEIGMILDALQPVMDLADNLADEELDRALGRSRYLEHYRDIPRETLYCLPAMMASAIVAHMHRAFPVSAFGTHLACRRLLATVGSMSLGQGLPLDDASRIDAISGQEGRLFCLPLWLWPDTTPAHLKRIERAEAWAVAYGRTWQLAIDAREQPGDATAVARLRDGAQRAVAAWPDFPPFRPGELFSAEAVLPKGWFP